MKKYLPIQINQEWHLRESMSPKEQYEMYNNRTWSDWNKEAIANAKPIINHVEGREWYYENDVLAIYQIKDEETNTWSTLRHASELIDDLDSPVRQAWKYIGEKPVETPIQKLAAAIDKAGKITFGLQTHQIELIEASLKKYDTPEILRSEHFWNDIAKEISWSPLSVATYYFYHRKQAERTRIIGIIEAEMERLSEYKSNRGRMLALENLLTKLKDL